MGTKLRAEIEAKSLKYVAFIRSFINKCYMPNQLEKLEAAKAA